MAVRKIPITINPVFWLMAALIGWMSTKSVPAALLAMVVIFISVLFHEFGHALTGLLFDQKVRIELTFFGGVTTREGRKLKLWEEFLVVLNGPLFGFLLFVIGWIITTYYPPQNAQIFFMLKYMWIVNLFWTVMNLLPILPLDGGHLLSVIFQAIFGIRGIRLAMIFGLVLGAAVSVLAFIFGQFFIGALFLLMTFEGFRSLRYYKLLREDDRNPDLQKILKEAEAEVATGDEAHALEKFEKIRAQTKGGVLYTGATETMARILARQGKDSEAYALLKPVEKSLSPESLPLLQELAFRNSDYKKVIALANESYQLNPTYKTAARNALAYGALGQAEPAAGWFECAVRGGLPHPKDFLTRKEFDPIRSDPIFKNLLNRY